MFARRHPLFDDVFDALFGAGGAPNPLHDESGVVRQDIQSDDSGVTLNLEVPGLSKEDVTVETEDGKLIVSGESPEDAHRQMKFKRVYHLGKGVTGEHVTASLKNGVLKVHIAVPLPEKNPPARSIPIN